MERLIEFFNHGVCPVVYQQGSVGASGDLVPLAHLCLPLVGLGHVEYEGKIITGEELNEKMGWKPIHLASKEGLALLNGTQNMLAFFAWSVLKAQDLSKWADLIATMSLDAFDGRIEPFLHPVHAVRPHRGQMETADHIYELLQGSELIKQHKTHVQDPYSFRCIPQVHGAFKDTLHYVEEVCTTEMNSATDNPTVVPEEDIDRSLPATSTVSPSPFRWISWPSPSTSWAASPSAASTSWVTSSAVFPPCSLPSRV